MKNIIKIILAVTLAASFSFAVTKVKPLYTGSMGVPVEASPTSDYLAPKGIAFNNSNNTLIDENSGIMRFYTNGTLYGSLNTSGGWLLPYRLAVGSTAAINSAIVGVFQDQTSGSGSLTGVYGNVANNQNNPSDGYSGGDFIADVYGTGNSASVYGLTANAYGSSSGTSNGIIVGGALAASITDPGTYTNLIGADIYASLDNSFGDPTISGALYGIRVNLTRTGGTIPTAYGIYLPNFASAGTTPWAIYSAGGQSSHSGNFRFGSNVVPTSTVDVTGTLKTSSTITDGSLTSGRVTFASTGGLLSDDADLTFSVDTLTSTKISTGTLTDSGLTAGSIPYAGTGGLISQNNANLFWDNANTRLGIDTASPEVALHVAGDGERIVRSAAGVNPFMLRIQNSDTSTTPDGALEVFEFKDSGGTVRQTATFGAEVTARAAAAITTEMKWGLANNAATQTEMMRLTNTELKSTTAGTLALGTSSAGWGSIYLDESGAGTETNQIISPTLSGNAVQTLPSTTGTLINSANNISALASSTSAQLATLLSDETGTAGNAVFSTSPSITTPKIITSINDTNANELLRVTATASAVNDLTLANAATAGNPKISATGDDANIGIDISPKGTGVIRFTANSTGPAETRYFEATGTGTNYISIVAPSSIASDVAQTLPTASGTLINSANKLSALSSTTSSELAGVISDETGTGSLMFGTSPRVTTSILDTNGNTMLTLSPTASAVNNFQISNDSLTFPTLSSVGTGTDVEMAFQVKGAGRYNFKGTSTSQANLRLYENSGNGSSFVELRVPSDLTGSYSFQLPNSNGVSGYLLKTDGSGDTSWVSIPKSTACWNAGVTGVGGSITSTATWGAAAADAGVVIPFSGQVSFLSLNLNQARTAGTLTMKYTINGVDQSQTIIINGTITQRNYKELTTPIAVNAGDYVELIVTTSGFTPTGADATVSFCVERL